MGQAVTPDDTGRFTEPEITSPIDGVLYEPRYLYTPNPFPACRGIYVGGCIRGDRWGRESAHAHVYGDDEYQGIICVWEAGTVWGRGHWAPELLMWHEYAHILEPDGGHDDHQASSPWGLLMQRWGLAPSRVT